MRVRHPLADEGVLDDYVDVRGDLVPVDDDGTFTVPDSATGWLEAFADRYDADPDGLRVADTCDVVKSDGEVCGRTLPCRYHSEED